MAGFDDVFTAPHSRYSAVETAGIRAVPEPEILAESGEAGVYAIWAKKRRQLFVLGHPEYDRDSLQKEYLRDLTAESGAASTGTLLCGGRSESSGAMYLALGGYTALCQLVGGSGRKDISCPIPLIYPVGWWYNKKNKREKVL